MNIPGAPATENVGQVVLITGASSGIGLACAVHLQQRGYRVYGASRHIQAAHIDQAVALPMDVDDDGSVEDAIARLMRAENRLDVVVNGAGFGIAGAIEDTSVEEAREQMETNLFGVLRVCRAALPIMRRQRSGLIVNISSLAGLTGIPFQGLYSASKFALEGFTESLRMEVARFGVKVVLIEPGDFATDFTNRRRRTRESQGDSAYEQACDRAVSRMEQQERNGPSPERIAHLLEKIMKTPTPRLRYTVGLRSQRVGVGLKRYLPYRMYQRLLMMTSGLGAKRRRG